MSYLDILMIVVLVVVALGLFAITIWKIQEAIIYGYWGDWAWFAASLVAFVIVLSFLIWLPQAWGH